MDRKKLESKILLITSDQTKELMEEDSDNDGKLQMPNDEDDET